MVRRNTLPANNDAEAAAKLNDDEEIVLTDTRTIRKNKRTPPPEIKIDEDDLDAIDGEIVDDDEDAPLFPEGTVGFRAFGEDGDGPPVTECNILVVRKPDGAKDNFLRPCSGRVSELPIRNIDLSTPESEVEEIVVMTYGGGHYYLQTQIGNKNGRGWSVSLADPPAAVAAAKAAEIAASQPVTAPAAPATTEPSQFERRVAELRLEKEYDELKFGDERRRLERLETELAELRNAKTNTSTEPRSEKLELLDFVSKLNNRPELAERVVDGIFPNEDSGGGRHWLADIISVAIENKDTIGSLFGSLLGGGTAPATQPSIADMLRQQPPTAALPPTDPARSGVRRSKPEPPSDPTPDVEISYIKTEPSEISDLRSQIEIDPTPEVEKIVEGMAAEVAAANSTDDETASDATAKDAEIITETKNAKPKRGVAKPAA